jgi:hypothetical protein
MNKIVKKILIGASIAASVSAIASAPAQAGSLTNATIGGTAASDYFVYDVQGNNTVKVQSNLANVNKVLDGNAANPTGNVELRASSEQTGFDFTKNTSLSGTIGGKNITLSSLTASDWNSSVGNGMTFAQKWFNEALTANGFGKIVDTSSLTGLAKITAQGAYSTALAKFNNGGRERFSDPNISYVNQDDNTGEIKIGLAGHFDAVSLLFAGLTDQQQSLVNQFRTKLSPIQASEIVKVSYNNGPAQLLYSFNATATGLTALDDGKSHNGNYEVTLAGQIPTAVPEPSVMLGLLGVAGVFKVQRQRKKVQA